MGSKRPGASDPHPKGRSRAEDGQGGYFAPRGMPDPGPSRDLSRGVVWQGKIVDDAVAEVVEAKPDLGQIPPIKARDRGVPTPEPLPGETQ